MLGAEIDFIVKGIDSKTPAMTIWKNALSRASMPARSRMYIRAWSISACLTEWTLWPTPATTTGLPARRMMWALPSPGLMKNGAWPWGSLPGSSGRICDIFIKYMGPQFSVLWLHSLFLAPLFSIHNHLRFFLTQIVFLLNLDYNYSYRLKFKLFVKYIPCEVL